MSIYIECEYCGTEFIAERPTAKYCCDSHKTLANRERRRLEGIEDERQLQQNEFDKIQMELEEARIQREEQAAAETAERIRLKDAERLIYEEKRRKYKEQQRIKIEKRRKEEFEKSQKRADINFNLKLLSGAAIIWAINRLINPKDGSENNAPKRDDKNAKSNDITKSDSTTSQIKENTSPPPEIPDAGKL